MKHLDPFTLAYIECALWSSTDDREDSDQGGPPLNRDFDVSDISPGTLAVMISDCQRFQSENKEDINGGRSRVSAAYTPTELAGYDFWLTRNGHGAGFWDGDWEGREIEGVSAGIRLTIASKKFGEVDIYVGDDGVIYQSPEK